MCVRQSEVHYSTVSPMHATADCPLPNIQAGYVVVPTIGSYVLEVCFSLYI